MTEIAHRAGRGLSVRAPGGDAPTRPGHPWWCAADHRCTARFRSGGGEHTSIPEVWRTALGRVVATRHRQADGREHVEVRLVLSLPDDDEAAQDRMRMLIVAAYAALDDVA